LKTLSELKGRNGYSGILLFHTKRDQ
jgi:hypothetical protein